MDYTEREGDMSGISHMYPDKLVPLLNTCIFEEEKNVAQDLDIGSQARALKKLHTSSKAFLAASSNDS